MLAFECTTLVRKLLGFSNLSGENLEKLLFTGILPSKLLYDTFLHKFGYFSCKQNPCELTKSGKAQL